MSKINVGMMSCFAVKRWPEPEVWCRIIKEELGLSYAQFSFDLLDPRTLEGPRAQMCLRTKQATEKYGIHLTSAFTGLASYSFNLLCHPDIGMRMDALDWYEKAIYTAAEMGAWGTGGHVAALSMSDFENERRKDYLTTFLLESLEYLSGVGKNVGQKFLLWEPMPIAREAPCTIDGAKRIYERVNENAHIPVQFCLDLGHQCTYTAKGRDRDTYEWLRQLSQYSPVIHIQQTDGKGDRHWPFTEDYNRKGIIRPQKVIEAINVSGAEEVTLLFEIIHPPEIEENKVLDDLKESVEYWEKYTK